MDVPPTTEKQAQAYPGSKATVEELVQLAEVYRDASQVLLQTAKKGGRLSYAPARLCAIHAIELYLNAFLRFSGTSPEQIRARVHNLADANFVEALRLRKKTSIHLIDLTERREYLITRYAPELTSQLTELNRLTATLHEVRAKLVSLPGFPRTREDL